MKTPGERFYLMHSERKLLRYLFSKRNHSLGVNREKALYWVQGDLDRLNRLLEAEIIQAKGQVLRLSIDVLQFFENEIGVSDAYRVGTFVEEVADWMEAGQTDAELATALENWATKIPPLLVRVKEQNRPIRKQQLEQALQTLLAELESAERFQHTPSLTLAVWALELQEQIPQWLKLLSGARLNALQQQVEQLHRLVEQGLLTERTNILEVLAADKALVWQTPPRFQTQLSLEQVSQTKKRSVKPLVFPKEEKHERVPSTAVAFSKTTLAETADWELFLASGTDLVSFLKKNLQDWEGQYFDWVLRYGGQLTKKGKPIKVKGKTYPRLVKRKD